MNSVRSIIARGQTFEGPELTWAGPHPFKSGICLGFENGSLAFSVDKETEITRPQKVSPAEESINGIASIGSTNLAVSTRADVSFVHFESQNNHPRATFVGGSHGVVATRSGYFIAPLGNNGLLMYKPEQGSQQLMRVTTGSEGKLYFYRMAVLHKNIGQEVLVFANRRQGIGTCEFNGNDTKRHIHTRTFEGLDVVDVCSVHAETYMAIAISPKAEVMLYKDVLSKERPVTLRLGGIEGNVYRVLSTAQHLFVLSDKALYIWPDFVRTALLGLSAPRISPVVLPMNAIDMNICNDKHLLLVLATNQLMAFEIKNLLGHPNSNKHVFGQRVSDEMSRKVKLESFEPSWQNTDVEQGMMAGVG